jgi:hypothetical protein
MGRTSASTTTLSRVMLATFRGERRMGSYRGPLAGEAGTTAGWVATRRHARMGSRRLALDPGSRSLATRVQLRRPRFGNVDTSGSLRIQSRDGCGLPLSVAAVRTAPWTSIWQSSPVAREVWADSSRSGLRSGDCASSSPTPTTLRPPNSSPSSTIVVAGRSSWTPTLLTQRRSSGS